jgi:hypothetical protein
MTEKQDPTITAEQSHTALEKITEDAYLQKDVQELLRYIEKDGTIDPEVIRQFILAAVAEINRQTPNAHFYYQDARMNEQQESNPELQQFIGQYRQDFQRVILEILNGDIHPSGTLSPAILELLKSKKEGVISVDTIAAKMLTALKYVDPSLPEKKLNQLITLYILKKHFPKGWKVATQYFQKEKVQELEKTFQQLNMDIIYAKIKIGMNLGVPKKKL